MIYSTLIFAFSVVVFGIKNYLKDNNVSLFVKLIHLLISFILFHYYFGHFRWMLWQMIRLGGSTLFTTNDFNNFSKAFDLTTSILFFLTSVFMSGLSLNLAAKAKSRKLLLFSTPLIIIITGLDFLKMMINEFQATFTVDYALGAFIFTSVIFLLINLFYNLNPGKKLFITRHASEGHPNSA